MLKIFTPKLKSALSRFQKLLQCVEHRPLTYFPNSFNYRLIFDDVDIETNNMYVLYICVYTPRDNISSFSVAALNENYHKNSTWQLKKFRTR